MRAVKVAWAAGVFDGEGCITINKQRPGTGGRKNVNHRLYIKVTMGHLPTVERLQDIFGKGTITLQKSAKGHNDAHTWWVASREAGEVLGLMRQYLITKAAEADLAFEFLALPIPPRGGAGGNQCLPPEVIAARERLFIAMRDIKPSARFRKATKQ